MASAIEAENLVFHYHLKEALHRISFKIAVGEVAGLFWPNGAGKSTTLKILAGLLAPGEGSVRINGFSLSGQTFDTKRILGYVPESANLYESLMTQEFFQLVGRLREIEEKALQQKIITLIE
jgi:ABC-2 type transport system ATP-binding protein